MKRTINEAQLKAIVAESVRRVLNERYSRYIDTENDRFIGNAEGYPYHEYVTRDGKLHRHDTWPNASSTSSTAYGDEYEPIDYDGRYDNDEMFKKYMGLPHNENRFEKEEKASDIIEQSRRFDAAYKGIDFLLQHGFSFNRAWSIVCHESQAEDLTDSELENIC